MSWNQEHAFLFYKKNVVLVIISLHVRNEKYTMLELQVRMRMITTGQEQLMSPAHHTSLTSVFNHMFWDWHFLESHVTLLQLPFMNMCSATMQATLKWYHIQSFIWISALHHTVYYIVNAWFTIHLPSTLLTVL